MKILCLIPARSGSKGIEHKNIKSFYNKPLIYWTIIQALSSKYKKYMRIIVTTDSQEYAKIALKYGAEVPFIRPKNISQDDSTDFQFIDHALTWLKKNENYNPDFIVQLRPTQPCRSISDIDECINIFIQNRNKYNSLRTVVKIEKSPYKMYNIENNILNPLFKQYQDISEPYNQCRQVLPDTYLHNGYIDILNTDIVSKGQISGSKIYPYIMKKSDIIDIDTLDDWAKAEKQCINLYKNLNRYYEI